MLIQSGWSKFVVAAIFGLLLPIRMLLAGLRKTYVN